MLWMKASIWNPTQNQQLEGALSGRDKEIYTQEELS